MTTAIIAIDPKEADTTASGKTAKTPKAKAKTAATVTELRPANRLIKPGTATVATDMDGIPEGVAKRIALTDLHVSKTNMRASAPTPDVRDLVGSLRKHGVRQPLIVRAEIVPDREDDITYGIIAGRRRFHGVLELARQTSEADMHEGAAYAPTLPCLVVEADDAQAMEISLLENSAREDATPMQEFRTYAALVKAGTKVEAIADTFGVPLKTVRQRLALGKLPKFVQAECEADRITGQTLTALTMATRKQVSDWVKLYKDPKQRAPLGANLRAWLSGGSVIKTDAALFDIKDFSGRIIEDLFGEAGQFAKPEEFWAAQNAAITELEDQYRNDGWEVERKDGHFHSWNYRSTPKDKGGRVYISVRDNGEVETHEGYITEKEWDARARAAAKGKEAKAKPAPKPEMTGPMLSYMNLHRHSAVRDDLVRTPDMAVRLLCAHLVSGGSHIKTESAKRRARKEATNSSAGENTAERLLQLERDRLATLLGMKTGRTSLLTTWEDGLNRMQVFEKTLRLSDEDVTALLAFLLTEIIAVGSDDIEVAGTLLDTQLGDVWTPDMAFLDLLRDKAVINKMVSEVAGKSVAAEYASSTGKKQKSLLWDRINGTKTREANTEWRPRWASFPATPYRKQDGCEPAQRFARFAKLFKPHRAEAKSA